jgi:seryl-tRNA synthetase
LSIWLDKDQEDLINECQAKLAETEEKYDSAFNELLKVRAELRSEKGNAIAIKKQLAEMQKEIKSNCEQHEIERQDLMKVIDHWKRSYNQAADEREEAKNMLLAVVRKLPIPKDVKMFKMQKCAACEKELVLHCPDDCP